MMQNKGLQEQEIRMNKTDKVQVQGLFSPAGKNHQLDPVKNATSSNVSKVAPASKYANGKSQNQQETSLPKIQNYVDKNNESSMYGSQQSAHLATQFRQNNNISGDILVNTSLYDSANVNSQLRKKQQPTQTQMKKTTT